MSNKILVSVIVPIHHSKTQSVYLKDMLDSFKASSFKNFELIINDEEDTNKEIQNLIEQYINKGLSIQYLNLNTSRSQARKSASSFAKGEYLLHLDSDMRISDYLLDDCIKTCVEGNFDALIIPEVSIANNFWGKCRAMEKECYMGVEYIESVRFMKKEIYDKVGGHNERMIFAEDKDLDLRVRGAGYVVGRAEIGKIFHNEGMPSLRDLIWKKFDYSLSANLFATQHKREFLKQSNVFLRYVIFLKNYKLFFRDPIVYCAMIKVKTLEYFFSACGLILSKFGLQKNTLQ